MSNQEKSNCSLDWPVVDVSVRIFIIIWLALQDKFFQVYPVPLFSCMLDIWKDENPLLFGFFEAHLALQVTIFPFVSSIFKVATDASLFEDNSVVAEIVCHFHRAGNNFGHHDLCALREERARVKIYFFLVFATTHFLQQYF